MTEPSPPRPQPGPPRPGPPRPGQAPANSPSGPGTAPDERRPAGTFDDLEERPVAEHVGVFEAEHARLQRELGTIDEL
jgi:hypothetical protein